MDLKGAWFSEALSFYDITAPLSKQEWRLSKTVGQAISIWRANSLYIYINWSLPFEFLFDPLNLYLLLHILLLLLLFLNLQLMKNWEISVILTVFLQLAP